MDKSKRIKNRKGGHVMALLAMPKNKTIAIDKDKSKKFLEDSRKNTISPLHLEKCKKYAILMKNKKNI
jgi:ribosomal protein L25 (general stress protein Ctc)